MTFTIQVPTVTIINFWADLAKNLTDNLKRSEVDLCE